MKRKHWMQLGLAASSMVLLTGCYQRYQRQTSNKKEPVTSQSTAKKQAKKADNKQLYQSVFSDYQKIFATSKDLDAISKLNDELANQQSNGSYFVTGVYYLKDKKPTLLAEGFVAGHGGARNATTLYKGGEVLEVSWLSGTGRGEAVLSRLEKAPQMASKVKEEEVQVPGSDLNAIFGKSDEDKLDLESFDWQSFDSTPSGSNTQSQEKRPWNAEKSAKLAEFMKTWGQKMGQPNYQKGIAGGSRQSLYSWGQ